MVRVTTNNYGATTDTQFAWATSGTDLFSRTQDLYRLAQAVEFHDHGPTRGLPVVRLSNNAVTETSISALSVTSTKLADGAVTVTKIGDGQVTDAKMTNQKINRVGDIMTGDFRVYRGGDPSKGFIFLGDGSSPVYGGGIYFGFDGIDATFSGTRLWHSNNDGAGSGLDADLLAGQGSGYYASAAALTAGLAAVVTFPLSGVCWFQNTAQLSAAGSHFAKLTGSDGRLLLGAGISGGYPFSENATYGATWTPAAAVTVNNGSLGVSGSAGGPTETFPVSGGGTQVASGSHSHSISVGLSGSVAIANTAAIWHPPLWAGVWGQRTN